MLLALAALAILALVGIAFFCSYAFRAVLPKEHSLQSSSQDEAIEARTKFLVKNYKMIIGVALIAYFTFVTVVYS